LAIVVAVVDEATLEEDSLDDDDEDAVIDEAPLEEDGLDDDDDDTATEVLDVADVDRTMRDADGSSPMTEVDMMEKAAGRFAGRKGPEREVELCSWGPNKLAAALTYYSLFMQGSKTTASHNSASVSKKNKIIECSGVKLISQFTVLLSITNLQIFQCSCRNYA
jgi:hypothetical protein